jgi:hypothetical protein
MIDFLILEFYKLNQGVKVASFVDKGSHNINLDQPFTFSLSSIIL